MVTGDKSSADAERYELTLVTVLTSLTVLDANQNVNKVNIINHDIEVSHGNPVRYPQFESINNPASPPRIRNPKRNHGQHQPDLSKSPKLVRKSYC